MATPAIKRLPAASRKAADLMAKALAAQAARDALIYDAQQEGAKIREIVDATDDLIGKDRVDQVLRRERHRRAAQNGATS